MEHFETSGRCMSSWPPAWGWAVCAGAQTEGTTEWREGSEDGPMVCEVQDGHP